VDRAAQAALGNGTAGPEIIWQLNAWLLDRCVAYGKAHKHPELSATTTSGRLEVVISRGTDVCRLTAGGKWIRTDGSAATE
jgi:hypothetical protein